MLLALTAVGRAPQGHVGYLMFVLFHPHILELHRLCLGCEHVYQAHVQLNNKAPGDAGGGWHTHAGRAPFNDAVLRGPEDYMRHGVMNLLLACELQSLLALVARAQLA